LESYNQKCSKTLKAFGDYQTYVLHDSQSSATLFARAKEIELLRLDNAQDKLKDYKKITDYVNDGSACLYVSTQKVIFLKNPHFRILLELFLNAMLELAKFLDIQRMS
jgi:hypothetical protein